MDLGTAQPVGGVKVYTDRPRSRRHNIQVRYSTDGSNFTPVFGQAQVTLQQAASEWHWTPANARWLRFEVIGQAGWPVWFRLIEIEWYPV